jgi:hypothetical protein
MSFKTPVYFRTDTIITFSFICVKCNVQNMFVRRQPITLKTMAEIEGRNKNSENLFP